VLKKNPNYLIYCKLLERPSVGIASGPARVKVTNAKNNSYFDRTTLVTKMSIIEI
jgi:hypothetical protein